MTASPLSERTFRSIVESAPFAVVLADTDGRILLVNSQTERLFGYTRDELVGRGVELLVPAAVRERHAGLRAGFRAEPTARPMGAGRDLQALRKDGTLFPVEIGLNPIETEAGTLVMSAIVDISERKRLEQELHRRVSDLAQADREKDQFLAMLGHELRNPLAPLRNAAAILRTPGLDGDTLAQTGSIVERQVEQLQRLADDLLDVSRIVKGQVELRRDPIDLAVALQRGAETAEPALRARGHELSSSMPRSSVLVHADLIRISQVVANLLTNAAKYTSPGGRVWLSLERDGESAVVRVRDSGSGIAPELLPHVFDLFVRGDSEAVRSQGGLGLGLTLVKRTVELHGGSVGAYSAGEGRGSEFVVRLPLAEDSALATPPPASRPKPERRGGRRVLVVDDSVDSAETMAVILRVHGHTVECAFDGRSALRVAGAFEPEVVLLDLVLPDMPGQEVARELRRQRRGTVVVAVTGHAREAGGSSFDHHLTKPVDPAALAPAIERWTKDL